MRRNAMVFVIAAGMVGCGGGEGVTPVVDPGTTADQEVEAPDRGEVVPPEVTGDADVPPNDALKETEVSDICAQLKCEEMYKVFPDLGRDGKPVQVCFRWTCDPVRGQCVVEFLQGVRCDDGLECTRMDTCVDGRCVGLVDDCECSGGSGECSDGDPCTLEDHCAANGKCLGGPEKDCKEHEEEAGDCRMVECFLGACMWSPLAEGESCRSPNRCFLRGRCDGRGHCVEDLDAPQNCDDGNPCTDDGCDTNRPGADPETGCYHEPNSNPCDDQNECTNNDHCQAGACIGTPVDCEDGNPCTDDRPETCDPKTGCGHPKLPDGTDCDDESECTPVSSCMNGLCVGTVNCDDGDQCTDDSCGTDKKCQHKQHTRPCNDGDPCTQEDRCGQDGLCRGTPVPCPGNTCNDGACAVVAGQGVCVLKPKALGTPCDDGNGCTTGDACGAPGPDGTASCTGQVVTCAEKSDECNDGVCIPVDPKTHVCVANPKVGKPLCDDGDLCTVGDYCQYGKCVSGGPKPCDPAADPCEQNRCDPATGQCVLSLKTGSCSDGNACTVGDVCVAGTSPEDGPGKCVGTLLNCNDLNVCTLDTCDPEVGCRHAPRLKECSNATGVACLKDQDCMDGGKCVEVSCADDGNPCTRDICAEDGTCKHVGRYKECQDGRPCMTDAECGMDGPCGPVPCADDGIECTVDICWWDGSCRHVQRVKACPDGIPCLADSECGGAPGSCMDVGPVTCNDRDKCSLEDHCTLEGTCVGTPRDCTDYEKLPSGPTVKNVCTDDFCDQNHPAADPETGCYHVFNSNPCDDQDPCTRAEKCSGALCDACFFGHCQGPILRDCADTNPCTLDGCDQFHAGADAQGCWHDLVAPGTACDDLNLCTFNDRCNALGVCGGDPVDCNDENQCTNEVGCDPVNGCIRTLATNGTPCDDSNACTLGDRCFAGVCSGPNQVNCNDSNPCTVDWCLPTEGCQHDAYTCDDGFSCTTDTCKGDGSCQFTLKSGWCLIDGMCYASGTLNPSNDCQACNPSLSTSAWSNLGSGVACADDGVSCTVDQCNGLGTCLHPIAQDWCRVGGTCYIRDTLNPSNDCQVCNPSQSQTAWSNLSSGAPCADDGDWCTVDQCNGLGTCTHTTATDSCKIKGVCYAIGTINPDNDCQECNPALSKTAWSNRTSGAGCADDGVTCTLDQCNGLGTCSHVTAPERCRINGVCYERGDLNPTNECQECDPSKSQSAWSNRASGASCADDGVTCTLDQCDGFGTCSHVTAPERCRINGVCYERGDPNPTNECQECDPSKSQSAWSNRASGASCADDGVTCTLDQCNGLGTCSHVTAPERCRINGVCYARGDLNPTNECQECDPSKSQTTWSNRASGASCADDGVSCTLDQCDGLGVCKHPIQNTSCRIDGTCYEAGTISITNDCKECNPTLNQTAWSNRGSGASCADDGDWCTTDQCDGFGTCLHTTATETCKIQGVCYGAGVANPSNDCQECNPALSKTAWSNRTSGAGCADDGVTCTLDQCNGLGTCTHPIASTSCRIAGTCHDAGTVNLANDCQECNPTLSQTAWSNRGSGASCADDGDWCTLDQCNGFGLCQHTLSSNACRIDGTCYASGTTNPQNPCQVCNPVQSQASWSNKASGTSCTTDNLDCTNDICNADGACTHPVKSGYCLIGGECKNNGDQNPNNQCQECNPAQNPTEWTAKSNGTLCSDGNACTLTDVCFDGICQPGSPKTCTAPDQCHEAGTCNPESGTCSYPNKTDGTLCNDGNQCTVGETCQNGTCTGGTAVVCNDNNPCTDNLCAVGTGCYYPPKSDGTDCSSDCATGATCVGGQCQGTFKSYGDACTSDAFSCTDDICNGQGSCIHPVQAGKCLIGGTCYSDGAENGKCQECAPSVSQTSWTYMTNKSCNDGNACTHTDKCVAGGSGDAGCQGTAYTCDDGKACTDNVCDGTGGCNFPIQSGKCLIDGTCRNNGDLNPANDCQVCIASQSQTQWSNRSPGSSCTDDGKTCTNDQCDGAGACQHPIQSGMCLISGTCYNDGATHGLCEECEPSVSQTAWTYMTGKSCDDGNACSHTDVCMEGGSGDSGCQGTAYTCDDGKACTDNVCDGTGGCNFPIQSDKCLIDGTCRNNGDLNPANDCQVCIASQSQTQWSNRSPGSSCTDDGKTCTNDQCDGAGACQHPIQSGTCLISGTCYNDGDTHGLCEECEPSVSQTAWTYMTGKSCDDGNACSHTDVCMEGGSGDLGCQGTAYSCPDDGTYCNGTESCDGSGGCSHSGNPCPGHNTGPYCNDSCNEDTDDCTLNDLNGTPCGDGKVCCDGVCQTSC